MVTSPVLVLKEMHLKKTETVSLQTTYDCVQNVETIIVTVRRSNSTSFQSRYSITSFTL